ncbi:MAG: hypothetical protein VX404_03735 [Planctomycetota bacterium]|nr:hypothetical protein [Planctomycetota bacterium]
MRKDLSLIRRLEKIEKELGYCQIKLEKEQRLATRVHFLRHYRDQLHSALEDYPDEDAGSGGSLCGMGFEEIALGIVEEDPHLDLKPLLTSFLSIGMRPDILGELEDLEININDTAEKLATFRVFHDKIQGLQSERTTALSSFDLSGDEPVLAISDNFEVTETKWNVLTEDLTNLDDALHNVARAIDYLTSARNFVLTARSHFSVQDWLKNGYLVDLLKHSTVGRVREMMKFAERNLKRALGELICLNDEDYDFVGLKDFAPYFAPLLKPLYVRLFDDVFGQKKFHNVLQLVEERLDHTEKLHRKLQGAREKVFQSQLQHERDRERLFHLIGDERRKLRLAPS